MKIIFDDIEKTYIEFENDDDVEKIVENLNKRNKKYVLFHDDDEIDDPEIDVATSILIYR